MVTAQEIREQLASYLAQGLDLDVLEDWIAQRTWNIHQSQDLTAVYLAYAAELLFSEYSSDDLSEADLRGKLSLLVKTPITQVDHVIVSGSLSSNCPVPAPVLHPWRRQHVGTGAAELCA
jgi:hypothetical protein